MNTAEQIQHSNRHGAILQAIPAAGRRIYIVQSDGQGHSRTLSSGSTVGAAEKFPEIPPKH